MSYRVNKTTMLFDDLDKTEASDLKIIVEDLVLRGTSCWKHEAFTSWYKTCGFDERQTLLMMATAFPQRALLSLVNFYRR
jgi:hypothetical protein